MNGSILQTERDYSDTLPVLHDEVQGKVLNEVVAIIAEALAVQCVEERVAGPVGNAAAPVSLSSLAVSAKS